jgi:hypothetical protein
MSTDRSNHTPDAIPAYKLPLSDSELIMLGRLMAYWAQVDMFIDELIEKFFNISYHQRVALVGDKMVGSMLQSPTTLKSKQKKVGSGQLPARRPVGERNSRCPGGLGQMASTPGL